MWPPSQDVFSYTAAERPWTNLSWLFDVVVAGVYSLTGAIGLTILKAIAAGTAFALVVHTSRFGVSTWCGSVLAAILLLACFPQFTAKPEILTLLGLSVVLWIIHRWRDSEGQRSLWTLVPVILIWANLDPRAFLGLLLIFLYALGQSVGRLLGKPGQGGDDQGRHLWMVFAASLVAAMISPFGWHVLGSPLQLYGVEYPAFREYYGDVVVEGRVVSPDGLQYLPIFSGDFWAGLNYQAIAGLFLGLAAVVSLSLNWNNVDWGHVFCFVGFGALAMAGSHELVPASLVFCVIATLNAQQWYQANFRQSYSVETSELLFTRGGRALTVLALFTMSYLAVSGRLGGPNNRRTGFGWHSSLETRIDGYPRRPGGIVR